MADSVRRAEMAFKAALFFRWRIYPRRRAEAVSSESSRAEGVPDSLHRGRVFLHLQQIQSAAANGRIAAEAEGSGCKKVFLPLDNFPKLY